MEGRRDWRDGLDLYPEKIGAEGKNVATSSRAGAPNRHRIFFIF
jgi:hypothetical protein